MDSASKNNPPFLYSVAERLYNKHTDNLKEITIVVPSQRAGLFIKTHLSKIANKPIWSPKVITINEFIEEQGSVRITEHITLCFEQYNRYCQILKEEADSFSKFISWLC